MKTTVAYPFGGKVYNYVSDRFSSLTAGTQEVLVGNLVVYMKYRSASYTIKLCRETARDDLGIGS